MTHVRTGLIVALMSLAIALAVWPNASTATATLTLTDPSAVQRAALLTEFEGPDLAVQVRQVMDVPAGVVSEVRATAPQAGSTAVLAYVTAVSHDPRLAADFANTAAVLAASEAGLSPMLEPATPEPSGALSWQFWTLLTATVAVGVMSALTRSTSAKTR